MTAPDLHPEDLLDRELAGALTDHERAHLDAHLAACATCRFERQARADFAALPMPSLAIDSLVTRALAGAPVASRPRRRPSKGLIAAAVMLVGAVSFGAIGLARPIAVFLGLEKPEAPAVTPSLPSKHLPAHQLVPKPEPVPEPEAVLVEPVQPPAVVVEAPKARAATKVPAVTAPPIVQVEAAPDPTAKDLFSEATRERSANRLWEAEQLYRTLTVRFPNSPEAVTAHAVLGRLLIDLGRPKEALTELDATLPALDAGVREDALAHRAVALEALGESQLAIAAWNELLREFPNSIHARRARQRVEALSGQ